MEDFSLFQHDEYEAINTNYPFRLRIYADWASAASALGETSSHPCVWFTEGLEWRISTVALSIELAVF